MVDFKKKTIFKKFEPQTNQKIANIKKQTKTKN